MLTPNYAAIGLVLLLAVPSGGTAAAPAAKDCYVFTDEDGDRSGGACFKPAGRREFIKETVPVKEDGIVWNWTARTWLGRMERGSAANDYFFILESFSETPAADPPGGPAGEKIISGKPPSLGYSLSVYEPRGKRLWKKTVRGEGKVFGLAAARDGSVVVALTQCVERRNCPRLNGASPPQHRITAFGPNGKKLMSFPPRSGLCDFFDGLWVSDNGDYIVLPCGIDETPALPYFFKPKDRLLWRADKIYRSPKLNVTPFGDTDENTLNIRVYRKGIPNRDWEYVELPLLELDWTPVPGTY